MGYRCGVCSKTQRKCKWPTPSRSQSYLGSSASGNLIVLKPSQYPRYPPADKKLPRYDSARETLLVRLPDELLVAVLAFTVDMPEWRRKCQSCLMAVLLTCKRFHGIALPMQYHAVECVRLPPRLSARLFHRTLKATPTLGKLCKEVQISIADFSLVGGPAFGTRACGRYFILPHEHRPHICAWRI